MRVRPKGGGGHEIVGPVFNVFRPEINPGSPVDRPVATPPDIKLNQQSALEANSNAILLGIWGMANKTAGLAMMGRRARRVEG